MKMILDALKSAIGKVPCDCALMFSGGLDSGVLAALAKTHCAPMLYTVGMQDSHDLAAGKNGAEEVGLPWTGIVLSEEDILEACKQTLNIADLSPLELSFELPLQIVASRIPETNIISGQGADELFGGYNRYADMPVETLSSVLRADYEKLFSTTLPKEDTIAAAYGKTLYRPFLDSGVAEVALTIPVEEKISDGVNKIPLRHIAYELGLTTISAKEKKAAQYGSGIMKCMKSAAKKQGFSLEEYIHHLKTEME